MLKTVIFLSQDADGTVITLICMLKQMQSLYFETCVLNVVFLFDLIWVVLKGK